MVFIQRQAQRRPRTNHITSHLSLSPTSFAYIKPFTRLKHTYSILSLAPLSLVANKRERMGPSICPSSVAVLSDAAYEHQHPCSTDGEEEAEDDDEFEFRPLLPQPRRRSARTERRRTSSHVCKQQVVIVVNKQAPPSHAAKTELAPPPARRVVRWHHMAFGSVRVPPSSAMDMAEIRRRLKARQVLSGSENEPPTAAPDGWAPWRLIRSLSCKGVEAVAAAAPVRLV
jgi:hypothetical protein